MLLAAAQAFLQKEAEIFAHDNEFPQALVCGAFLWKMHQLKDDEQAIGAEKVAAIPEELTLQEYWDHRDAPNGPTNGQKWVHKLCSELDRQVIMEALEARKVQSSLHLVIAAQARLMKSNPPDPKWIRDVTYTPTMLAQRRKKVMEEVEAALALPKPDDSVQKDDPPEAKRPKAPVKISDKVHVRRAELRDLDSFLTFTARGGKILLLKRLEQEFDYAVLRTPQRRTLLSYGSYSRNPFKRDHTFKSDGDIPLADSLVSGKLADKWQRYSDRLLIESDSFEELKRLWVSIQESISGILVSQPARVPAAPQQQEGALVESATPGIDPSPI